MKHITHAKRSSTQNVTQNLIWELKTENHQQLKLFMIWWIHNFAADLVQFYSRFGAGSMSLNLSYSREADQLLMSLWYNHKRVPKWLRRGRRRIPTEQPTEASRQAQTRQLSTKSLPILWGSCLQSWRRTTTHEFWKFPKIRSLEYPGFMRRGLPTYVPPICWV